MDLLDLLALLLFAGGGWLWYDSLNAREKAIAAAKSSCASDDLLLLDETVAIARLGVGRNDDGAPPAARRLTSPGGHAATAI